MKKAVIYCRVSTEEQKKYGFSIETQLQTCQELARKEDYYEGKSGGNLNRTEAQELLKYCANPKNKVEAIIV